MKTKERGARVKGRARIKNIWDGMKDRCNNANSKSYKYYGGRGITICEEWQNDFNAFYEWATANGYADDLSIDRIDVNGNYEPSNCRWATAKEQCNNKRNNVLITYGGITHTAAEWGEITGLSGNMLAQRARKGYDAERIFYGDHGSDKIKNLREAYGLTQVEFAKRLGTTRETISNYENFRREPNALFFQKLKERFFVSDEFIGGVILEFAIKKKLAGTND